MGKVCYPAIFYHERDGGYSVVFPDLGNLATDGDSLDEARRMAVDCLAGYLWSAKQDDEIVPPPSVSLDPHCEDDDEDDYLDVCVEDVEVDVEAYAAEYFE